MSATLLTVEQLAAEIDRLRLRFTDPDLATEEALRLFHARCSSRSGDWEDVAHALADLIAWGQPRPRAAHAEGVMSLPSIDLTGCEPLRAYRAGADHGCLLNDVETQLIAWRRTRDRIGALPALSNDRPRSRRARLIDARSNRLYDQCSDAIASLEAMQSELLLQSIGGNAHE
jgi:hypothetical protein